VETGECEPLMAATSVAGCAEAPRKTGSLRLLYVASTATAILPILSLPSCAVCCSIRTPFGRRGRQKREGGGKRGGGALGDALFAQLPVPENRESRKGYASFAQHKEVPFVDSGLCGGSGSVLYRRDCMRVDEAR
jgi:hypothetical protein